MITKHKVLIIKLGHSETLCPEITRECSLGDVVRSTVILNYFKKTDTIVWLTDEKALPLLEENPKITRLLPWNLETALQLQVENFDTVINLEKHPGICALADKIVCWNRYGFRFNIWKGEADAHYNTEKVLELSKDPAKKDESTTYWQEYLASVIGKKWYPRDRYVLSPKLVTPLYDVGLNTNVGSKWPAKGWLDERWKELYSKLSDRGLSVSWQQGHKDIKVYVEWILSCATIITCDSLGMHLALGYDRNVIALFGPSPSHEVYLYDKGQKIQSKTGLMNDITVEDVMRCYENQVDS